MPRFEQPHACLDLTRGDFFCSSLDQDVVEAGRRAHLHFLLKKRVRRMRAVEIPDISAETVSKVLMPPYLLLICLDVMASLGPQNETQYNYSTWMLILGDTNRGLRRGRKEGC